MSDLKKELIRLGSTNPELRPHIRKVLSMWGSGPPTRDKEDLRKEYQEHVKGALDYFNPLMKAVELASWQVEKDSDEAYQHLLEAQFWGSEWRSGMRNSQPVQAFDLKNRDRLDAFKKALNKTIKVLPQGSKALRQLSFARKALAHRNADVLFGPEMGFNNRGSTKLGSTNSGLSLKVARLKMKHLETVREYALIVRGEHPSWSGDRIYNGEYFAKMIAPSKARELAKDIKQNLDDFSEETGLPPNSLLRLVRDLLGK